MQIYTDNNTEQPKIQDPESGTRDILALIAAFEGSVDVASIANRKRH